LLQARSEVVSASKDIQAMFEELDDTMQQGSPLQSATEQTNMEYYELAGRTGPLAARARINRYLKEQQRQQEKKSILDELQLQAETTEDSTTAASPQEHTKDAR
jgi:hypothetical protein